jgi:large subunit ribosomal protein L17e
MGKTVYSRQPPVLNKAVKTAGRDLRIHYKNTYETARAVKGMTIPKAKAYLKDVLAQRRCIPFVRYYGGIGRTGQAKEFGRSLGRWPQKSVNVVLGLLQNLEANANVKSLKNLTVNHVQVNRAAKGRRRTYRAHGRIGRIILCLFSLSVKPMPHRNVGQRETRRCQEGG